FAMHVTRLRALGFRESDFEAMKNYIAVNRPERRSIEENLSLVQSFGALVNAADLEKRQITQAQVQAFKYQAQRNSSDANREWAVGLLDCLDKQRQRTLSTYFIDRPGTMAMAPSSPDSIERELADFRSGQYLRGIEAEREKLLHDQMREVQP